MPRQINRGQLAQQQRDPGTDGYFPGDAQQLHRLGHRPELEVLPPEPQDGGAPRIGYFPDGIVERIAEIQRLKKDGWSMARIAERFGARGTTADASQPPAPAPSARPAMEQRRIVGLLAGLPDGLGEAGSFAGRDADSRTASIAGRADGGGGRRLRSIGRCAPGAEMLGDPRHAPAVLLQALDLGDPLDDPVGEIADRGAHAILRLRRQHFGLRHDAPTDVVVERRPGDTRLFQDLFAVEQVVLG